MYVTDSPNDSRHIVPTIGIWRVGKQWRICSYSLCTICLIGTLLRHLCQKRSNTALGAKHVLKSNQRINIDAVKALMNIIQTPDDTFALHEYSYWLFPQGGGGPCVMRHLLVMVYW